MDRRNGKTLTRMGNRLRIKDGPIMKMDIKKMKRFGNLVHIMRQLKQAGAIMKTG